MRSRSRAHLAGVCGHANGIHLLKHALNIEETAVVELKCAVGALDVGGITLLVHRLREHARRLRHDEKRLGP